MDKIIGKKIIEIHEIENLRKYEKVIVDLGCGDGKLTYRMAKEHRENFYIGIDAAAEPLEKISAKAEKKPAKGGLNNIIFLHERAEALPNELSTVADEIQINFPWGSLLQAVVHGDETILNEIKKIATAGAQFIVHTTFDEKYEGNYIDQRDLPNLNDEATRDALIQKYQNLGFKIQYLEILDEQSKVKLNSSWAKKILSERDRVVWRLEGVIVT